MSGFPSAEWMERFKERVNADAEMRVIGDWFTTAISFDFGGETYVIGVEKGRIVDIVRSPKLDVRSVFGMSAPMEIWRKFLSPEPEPLYHDFFAMLMRVPKFRLVGDTLVAMQNARALHRLMNIMRGMEAGHA